MWFVHWLQAASNLNSVQSKKNSSLSANDKVLVLASRTYCPDPSLPTRRKVKKINEVPETLNILKIFIKKTDNVPLSALWKIRLRGRLSSLPHSDRNIPNQAG